MADPMNDEMLAMIRRTWDGVDSADSKLTVTNTKTPGQLLHALSCAPRDVSRLLAEVERLTAQAQRVRDLCAGGPGPHNERQIWISDVLAALNTEEKNRG